MRYQVRRPGAGIVSRHRTLAGAQRQLLREQRGAARHGGYSRDCIVDVMLRSIVEGGHLYSAHERAQIVR